MGELIWVGNMLIPRGVVIGVGTIALLLVVGTFTYLTREQ